MERLIGALVELLVRVDAVSMELVVELRHPLATKVLTSLTGLGSVAAGLTFLGLFYLAEWREEFLLTLVTLSVAGVVVGALMATVQRPFPPSPVCQTGSADAVATSFPSGHAAAVTGYALVSWRSSRLPVAVVAPGAVLVAVSRVYLGTHYLTDTVAGVAIGVGAFLVARRVVDRPELERIAP